MDLTPLEIILIASTLLEFNPLFQTYKCVRTRSVKGVSIWTFGTILAIGALWLAYGISIGSWPLIVGNAIKLFASLTVVVAYAVYRKPRPAP